MDISKFDFTKFSKEKWKEVLILIANENEEVENIEIEYPNVSGEIIPQVKVTYVYETETDGEEKHDLYYTAFDVSYEYGKLEELSKFWRKIMVKEFGNLYRYKLINHLQYLKEKKIQQVDQEYYDELKELNQLI